MLNELETLNSGALKLGVTVNVLSGHPLILFFNVTMDAFCVAAWFTAVSVTVGSPAAGVPGSENHPLLPPLPQLDTLHDEIPVADFTLTVLVCPPLGYKEMLALLFAAPLILISPSAMVIGRATVLVLSEL